MSLQEVLMQLSAALTQWLLHAVLRQTQSVLPKLQQKTNSFKRDSLWFG